MVKLKIIILLSVLGFLSSCKNSVKEDDRKEFTYYFESGSFLGNSDLPPGYLDFNKTFISLAIYYSSDTAIEKCNIKSVTFDEEKNEYEYDTDKGGYTLIFKNDSIFQINYHRLVRFEGELDYDYITFKEMKK